MVYPPLTVFSLFSCASTSLWLSATWQAVHGINSIAAAINEITIVFFMVFASYLGWGHNCKSWMSAKCYNARTFQKFLWQFPYLIYQRLFFYLPNCQIREKHLDGKHQYKITEHFNCRKMIAYFSKNTHCTKDGAEKIPDKSSAWYGKKQHP